MRHQAIQYDKNTGQIRQVLDPERDMTPEEVVTLLRPEPHEAVIAYPKDPDPKRNRYHEWQEHVTRHTGKLPLGLHPDIEAHVRARLGL